MKRTGRSDKDRCKGWARGSRGRGGAGLVDGRRRIRVEVGSGSRTSCLWSEGGGSQEQEVPPLSIASGCDSGVRVLYLASLCSAAADETEVSSLQKHIPSGRREKMVRRVQRVGRWRNRHPQGRSARTDGGSHRLQALEAEDLDWREDHIRKQPPKRKPKTCETGSKPGELRKPKFAPNQFDNRIKEMTGTPSKKAKK